MAANRLNDPRARAPPAATSGDVASEITPPSSAPRLSPANTPDWRIEKMLSACVERKRRNALKMLGGPRKNDLPQGNAVD